MPTVRISSMYDLQTGSRMGLIGIHTPSSAQLATKYSGLLRNYKYIKVKRCSVKIACASVLPADPLQVGVTAGKISPADMMNPILYRAVSNDSWNFLVNRIYSPQWSGDSADGLDDALSTTQTKDQYVYYSLLAGKEWRKVMPQQGLSVKGLKPLVHEVVSVFGNQFPLSSAYSDKVADDIVAGSLPGASGVNPGVPTTVSDTNTVFRGRTLPMPAIPTANVDWKQDPMSVTTTPTIPKTMVLAIVMPFSELQQMYYRLIVSWDVVFFGLRPATDWSFTQTNSDGAYVRYSRWTISTSKELETDDEHGVAESVGVIDTLNMNPQLQMES